MSQKIVLACDICKSRNYTTNKTEQERTNRLQINKYCKTCGIHTMHVETK
ncbi:50S ribosomal protein L33 [Evansella cellulosilytica]|uniref:Large ribosomal subunit protein bL33 n=1 Tax=Evansella cellulosilytica (strain ATCC 21833 / DSM 2522 / FERM P-1141 / JCM 9156 / N-4) TaxID=649639 RepID=E6TSH6_EVAC2|nr:50S ribosomal protein L33 [Evansella cellulosilytica]ADU28391.1 ribosomal protein L33 [Evansella cellulosilytica DSM 2522]